MNTFLSLLTATLLMTTAQAADQIYEGRITEISLRKSDAVGAQIRLGAKCELERINGRLFLTVEGLVTRGMPLIYLNNPDDLNEYYATSSQTLEECNDHKNCAKGMTKVKMRFSEDAIEKTAISVSYSEQKYVKNLIPLKPKLKAIFECGDF